LTRRLKENKGRRRNLWRKRERKKNALKNFGRKDESCFRFGYGKIAEFIVREARQKYQQAIQMWSKGDLGNAELMLREVVEKVPDAPDPLLALGQLLLENR
jgi:TolA-binding protein